MMYDLLADLVVAAHFVYVSYVVFGQLLIVAGVVLRWAWIRNPWFRITHLLAILIVVFESLWSIECPLTTLEQWLRVKAGHAGTEESFVARIIHRLMFFSTEEVSEQTLMYCYIVAGLVVLATFLLAPPRFTRRRQHTETALPMPGENTPAPSA